MPANSNIKNRLLNAINPYHWATWLRNRAFDADILSGKRFRVPTICIGNITVGGTGKTPHTEYLARLLMTRYRVAVLSRGYGRRSRGFIKAATGCTIEQIGDEPFQIWSKLNGITVAVDEKRAEGIELLMQDDNAPDVVLLDDAFQHRYVQAGLNMLLVDSNRPIWNDSVLPIGRLRESAAGIERADIIVITKCNESTDRGIFRKRLQNAKGAPLFFSYMRYGTPYPMLPDKATAYPVTEEGIQILLVTGIAIPAPLKKELEHRGASVTLMRFADHHNFSDADLNDIARRFREMAGKNKMIVTTEKDATRLRGRNLPNDAAINTYIMPIEVAFSPDDEKMFNQIIFDYVTENSRNSGIPER